MAFAALIKEMAAAAGAGDGARVAACFCEQGVYDDVFYGAFQGRAAISDMIENYFHRDGTNFRWDMHDPISNGELAYARYVFSYDSKLPETIGKRALFEGVCIVRLQDGLILHYSEVANHGTGLVQMGFAAERIAKILAKEAKQLASRDEAKPHIQR